MTAIPTPPIAFVVGGSTGIGAAIAAALRSKGLDVHVFSRTEPQSSLDTWHRLNVTDPDAVAQTIGRALALTEARLDVLAYAAVHYGSGRMTYLDTPRATFVQQWQVAFSGLDAVLRATLDTLRRARPGLVLHVSSEVAFNPGPGRAGYAAAKAAATSLVASLGGELAPQDLRVVQMLPAGMVDTPGIRSRRPAGFDYSSYMAPDAFAPLIHSIVETQAAAVAGRTLVVNPDGSWRDIAEGQVASQSRRAEHG